MEGKRLMLDDRHAVRQHKVFAVLVVLGLLVVLAVWIIQVRMAVARGTLAQVRDGISDFSQTWQDQWNAAAGEQTADDAATVVTDAVTEATQAAFEEAVTSALQEQAAQDVPSETTTESSPQ